MTYPYTYRILNTSGKVIKEGRVPRLMDVRAKYGNKITRIWSEYDGYVGRVIYMFEVEA